MDLFKLHIDSQEFQSKPNEIDAPFISNRIIKKSVEVTAQQLIDEIVKGKTITPAFINKKVNGYVKRIKESWTSQSILCLDFDNEKEIDNPDYPHSSNRKKIPIKHVTLTLEQAKEQFKDSAMFIYTTFNHKHDHPKLRVVFAFDEVITNVHDIDETLLHYKKLYSDADRKCFERARMIYGGKQIYILNLTNRIPTVKAASSPKGGFGDYDRTKVLSNTIIVTKTPPTPINISDNIEYIKGKNGKFLKSILNCDKILFYTPIETDNYIKQQDISILLGVCANHNCLFHDDTSKSASIFYNQQSNQCLYHCHSSNCSFGAGTINKVMEKLTGLNKVQSKRFLRDIYNIQFHQTDWQKEQIEFIDDNIRYLQSGDMEIEYPQQYKIVKRYIPELIMFHQMSKDYLAPEHYTEEQTKTLFFASVSHFAKFMDKVGSEKRIGDHLALFAYFSYINKLSEQQIPVKLSTRAKLEALKGKNGKSQNLISFFEINSYSEDLLSFAEKKAEEYIKHDFTIAGLSYEMLHRALGEEEAVRVYPQMNGKKIKEKSHLLTKEIESATLEEIEHKGWVTEREIKDIVISSLNGITNSALHRQIKKIISELKQKYNLVRIRAGKEVMKELGISEILSESGNPSYPYILKKYKTKC